MQGKTKRESSDALPWPLRKWNGPQLEKHETWDSCATTGPRREIKQRQNERRKGGMRMTMLGRDEATRGKKKKTSYRPPSDSFILPEPDAAHLAKRAADSRKQKAAPTNLYAWGIWNTAGARSQKRREKMKERARKNKINEVVPSNKSVPQR
jgi:hypothetical protein